MLGFPSKAMNFGPGLIPPGQFLPLLIPYQPIPPLPASKPFQRLAPADPAILQQNPLASTSWMLAPALICYDPNFIRSNWADGEPPRPSTPSPAVCPWPLGLPLEGQDPVRRWKMGWPTPSNTHWSNGLVGWYKEDTNLLDFAALSHGDLQKIC